MAKVLIFCDDILEWATARGGNPIRMDAPDSAGSRTILKCQEWPQP